MDSNNKHLVLITPGQPATNPRLVKEVDAFTAAGFQVSVIYCFWASWGDAIDQSIIRSFPQVRWIQVGGHPKRNPLRYWFTRIRHKWFRKRYANRSDNPLQASFLEARAFPELLKAACAISADLYIAHNLGALPVAALAASKHQTQYAFDAEDFHRGQVHSDSDDYDRITRIEDAFLPGVSALWAASPMIGSHYQVIYPSLLPLTILNVFSKRLTPIAPIAASDRSTQPLRLFWFSQTIGVGRGIEQVIAAMGKVQSDRLRLTLVGACSPQMRGMLSSWMHQAGVAEDFVSIHEPLHPQDLIQLASAHDIGLAFETEASLNRQICLTNKLFTYILARLPIWANDTVAQKEFLQQHPGIGLVIDLKNENALVDQLRHWINVPEERQRMRSALEVVASTQHWEQEQIKLLDLVNSIIA